MTDIEKNHKHWRLMLAPVESDGGFYTPGYIASDSDILEAARQIISRVSPDNELVDKFLDVISNHKNPKSKIETTLTKEQIESLADKAIEEYRDFIDTSLDNKREDLIKTLLESSSKKSLYVAGLDASYHLEQLMEDC